MRLTLVALPLAAAIAIVGAAAERKNPWEWTVAERMTSRYDPTAALARRAAAEDEERIGRGGTGMLVDGRRDPELLMPYELMNHLVVAYYHRDQDLVRRWQERVFPRVNASLGPGADEKLRAVMRPFADAWRCEVLNDQVPPAPECSDRMHSLCPARGAALAAARNAFGQVEFDRFLYEVVAPHAITAVSHSSPSLTSAIEFHQWQEDGCPDPSGSRAHPPRQNDSSNF